MSNALYLKAKQALLDGDIDLMANTVKCVLIDVADYVVNLSTHDFLDDVPVAARVGTVQTLAGKSVTDGVFDASDVTFPSVSGDQCEALILWIDTGVESTSRLLAYIDTAAAGLPVTPTGVNITVRWDDGVNRILRLN